jgi:hypothetical protein
MLVADNLEVETLECRLSSKLFRGTVNSPIGLWTVNHIAKLNYQVERKSDSDCASSNQIRITPFMGGFNDVRLCFK